MDNRSEIREFLMTRRSRVTPQQAGLAAGANRRVPGLRRAEVAMLADVSVEYYSRVERGALAGVSDGVLEAIARALQLDEAERSHLFDLARAANNRSVVQRRSRASRSGSVRPGLQAALDAITACPALIRNGRMDVLATNLLGRAFYHDLYAMGDGVPNIARYTFIDDTARSFYPDWAAAADVTVAILRTEAGRDPHDKGLHDLIGELSTRCDDFRTRWGAHNVRRHGSGVKHFHHPVVGDLTFTYEGLEVTEDPGLQFLIYTAEPASPTTDALRLLGSWAASQSWSPH
ncbi:MAG TPA: helix-turn-helix transcriptional regulator, partial [Propionicimonas sp.]|nr:helix-turn-helix transcriptional regulator [Propionicimonas sp.]